MKQQPKKQRSILSYQFRLRPNAKALIDRLSELEQRNRGVVIERAVEFYAHSVHSIGKPLNMVDK